MKLKKALAVLLSLIMISSVGCKNKTKKDDAVINVWTATGTEKILQDYNYTSRYNQNTLSISAFRAERESAQIMISGVNSNGLEYNLTLSDLTSDDGNTLSKDYFTVYNQKYIEVTLIKDVQSPTSAGWYPDALLPMEKAIEYKENVLTGKNQGIWISMEVPETQKAGDYKGNFNLTVGTKNYNVPVEVTIYDYTLSDVTHSKSSFMILNEQVGWGEMDTTEEMMVEYYERLLDFRINAEHLPGNDMSYVQLEGDALERFLYYAEKYSRDPRMSSYNIPFDITSATITVKGQQTTIKSVNFDMLKKTMIAMAERSVEKGINLFEKAGTYFIFFDEYDQNNLVDTANYNLNKATEVYNEVGDYLEDNLVCQDVQLAKAIIDGARGVKNKVVGNLTEELVVDSAVAVPTIDKYNSELLRQMYKDFDYNSFGDNGELWTYTCVSPNTPYPTYHTEDVLISSRLYGWMMYNYNIVGNLYWDTTLFSWREESFGDLQLFDYYDTARRYPGANGDGYLFYPGRPYGIYGPVETIRLHSIGDANEDYDLMYALEEKYKERNISGDNFDNVMSLLNRNLFSGTQVRIRDSLINEFAYSRDALARLIELAYNVGVIIEDYSHLSSKDVFTLSAPSDVTITANGQTLSPIEVKDGYNVYKTEVVCDQTVNIFNLSATNGEKSQSVALNLGGKSLVVDAITLKDKSIFPYGTGTLTETTIEGTNALLVSYDKANRLTLDVNVSSINVDKNTNTVIIDVYAYENTEIEITSKCEKSSVYSTATKQTIEAGWNKINIPVSAFNCDQYGKLMQIRFILSGTEAKQIALGNFTVEG